jgi:DNA-binding LacI/PurR family transcriptional regulator
LISFVCNDTVREPVAQGHLLHLQQNAIREGFAVVKDRAAESRPTLDRVAAAAGVSRMTVSNAYNRPDQLSATTREHVLRVAATLGYAGPDPAGRSLRRRQTGTIGVLLTEQLPYAFSDPGLVSFLQGVATGLRDAGQAMLLLPAEGNQQYALVRNALVDGFIVASFAPRDQAVVDVLQRRLPLVTWGNLRLPGVARIGVDNAKAAQLAAKHLVGLRHRRFGVITFGAGKIPEETMPDADTAAAFDVPGTHLVMRQRVIGFRRALADGGIADDAVRVIDASANTRRAGEQALTELLKGAQPPTAVFGVTDVLALGALAGAANAGVNVPADISVVGFDDIDDAARSTPSLTTVAQGLLDQGRWAARLVLDAVAGGDTAAPPVRADLVVRASTSAN